MGVKFSGKEAELFKAIDKILWKDWDPIGVNDQENARDEYYSYLPKVYNMAINNSSAIEIGEYLFRVESEAMEMPSTLNHCVLIAEKILQEKERLKPD